MKHEKTPGYFHAHGGQLFDTRMAHWPDKPLRKVYDGNVDHRYIKSGVELRAILRQGPYTWPGGYPRGYLANDGAMVCHRCVLENLHDCFHSIRHSVRDGWLISGAVILTADDMEDEDEPEKYPGTMCAHCNQLIE